MKKIIAIALTIVMIAALAACGAPAPATPSAPAAPSSAAPAAPGVPAAPVGPVEFTMPTEPISIAFSWWGNDARREGVEGAINEFTSRYPNVSIEPQVESGPFAETIEKMITRLAAGTEADFNQVNYNWLHVFGQGNNVFADLRPYANIIDFDAWVPSDLQLMTLANGEVAGVPHNMNGRVVLYNKTLLAEFGRDTFPTTWEDMIALGREVAANNTAVDGGNNRHLITIFENVVTDNISLMLLYSATGKPHVVDGQLQYTIPEARDMLEKILEFDQSGTNHDFVNQDPINNEQSTYWTSGRSGAAYNWISNPNVNAGAFKGGGHEDELGMTEFPMPGGNNVMMVRPGMGHAMSRNTAHPEVVAYFLNYFYLDPVAVRSVAMLLGAPSAIHAFEILTNDGLITGLPALGLDILNNANVAEMGPLWEDETLRTAVRYRVLDAVRSGSMDLDTAAAEWVNGQQAALNLIFS